MLAALSRRPPPATLAPALPAVTAWWADHGPQVLAGAAAGGQAAVLAGFHAPSLVHAFVGGYQVALRALGLCPSGTPHSAPVSFCVTERGGNRPRDMATTLRASGAGQFKLSGDKSFVTLAPECHLLNVVAHVEDGTDGGDGAGRRRLVVVAVPANAEGVTMVSRPPLPFLTEAPHGTVSLRDVTIPAHAVYPGDGYDTFVKPFRTVEDACVHGAVVGHAARLLWSHRSLPSAQALIERLFAQALCVSALLALPPGDPHTHIALSGALRDGRALLDECGAVWAAACADRPGDAAEGEALRVWLRDWPRLWGVAATARAAPAEAAWVKLGATAQ